MRKRDFDSLKKKALKEGRLFFRVTDQNGYSCNGGDKSFKADPCNKNTPGKWTKKIKNVQLCAAGYHCTTDPVRWVGSRVCLVEVNRVIGKLDDKIVCSSFRELEVITPENCVDIRIYVACKRPYLMNEDLRGAYLRGANLEGANLKRTDLGGANLRVANLKRTDLREADLSGANLNGANLRGAYLWRASLRWANLLGASLESANLEGANLLGATLEEVKLEGATLKGTKGINKKDCKKDG